MTEQRVPPAGGPDVASLVVGVLGGTGDQGQGLARRLAAAGNPVIIGSRSAQRAAAAAAGLGGGPGIRGMTNVDTARAADVVIVAVPWEGHRELLASLVEPLAGKIVIDTNNYYPQRDGHIPELDSESTTTSELLQAHLPTSKVVKAFNHIYAAQITTDRRPAGTKARRGLVIAGNDAAAKATVTQLLDEFGYDTVDAGPLAESWRIQRDTPGYGPRRTAEELKRDLAAAKRPLAT